MNVMRPHSALLVLQRIAIVLAAAGLCGAVGAVELSQLRLTAGDTTTRAELSLDGAPGDYRVFMLSNPDRLVLDLPASRTGRSFRAPAPNGRVIGVRTGQPEPGKLRVVFDLGGAVKPRTRVEGAGRDTRLVLELFRPGDESAATVAASQPAAGDTPSAAAPGGNRELVVAIDAGHGGKDPGAIGGRGTYEKTVTLKVARELAEAVDAHPGMRAVLIRDGDYFIPLGDRYRRAREAQADLFVSIHADAALNSRANGASVFVLSTRGASSEAARWLADQENASDLVGGVSLDDKDRNLAAVLLDLSQNATLRVSDEAANYVLGALRSVGKTHKPQVERANFWVLRSPDVPSMLVETGFITNAEDERKLNDPNFRERIATVISDGLADYFFSQPPQGTWFAANAAQAPRPRQHVVARGETLGLIAARHGVSLQQLRRENRKNDDLVRVGETLRIPVAAPR